MLSVIKLNVFVLRVVVPLKKHFSVKSQFSAFL
jgi:hypothetical protein